MNKQSTIYAFIDSQNLNLSIRGQGWNLDFARFFHYMKDHFRVNVSYLFIGYVPGNQHLYTELQKIGYIIVFKPTLEVKIGNKVVIKGNVDAELVLHTMIEYGSYDQAVIVTGDGDFHCLIEYLKDKHKLGRLIIPNRHKFSSLLREFLGDVSFLNNTREKLGKISNKKRGMA